MADHLQGTDTPVTVNVPDKPALEGLEPALSRRWREEGVYKFNPNTNRSEVYSIDTPPPTASGSLHVGHMFSYTQTDVLARFQRMNGKNVFYPMGWDDNGLPTERRVQNYYGVRCDPKTTYDDGYRPPEKRAKNQRDFDAISRRNFIELCEELAVEDEKVFEDLFSTLGLSVDWDLTYRTIDDTSRAVSQRAFLTNLTQGDAYLAEAPTLWDVSFRTAVAQAELEDREVPGAYYRIPFTLVSDSNGAGAAGEVAASGSGASGEVSASGSGAAGEVSASGAAGEVAASGSGAAGEVSASGAAGEQVIIESTRPELLPACVALVANPDDERYRHLIGRKVRSPLFDVEVEIKAHPLAKPDKGSGIAMICTFGDLTDVTWWRELQLPTRAIVGRDGRILADTPAWIETTSSQSYYAELAGKTVFSAKESVVELLSANNLLDGEPKQISHPVNFFEKGDKPLEVVTSRQWYFRNGGREAERRERLIGRGREIEFHPAFMRSRYENWIQGLNGDWLVSRQRFFGVPIPVWYRLDDAGNPDYEQPILPALDTLPVDPAAEPAPGFNESQREVPGGFTGDADVLDTWATSSLTPQIVGKWSRDEDFFAKVFPFDLRPQGHDIIRTWMFSSAVRADSLQDSIPWKHAAISGWILDPDRKKMSKSKGNVVVPNDVLDEYGADAVRYWAASAKLGADTAYEIAQMKIGRRLAIKLLNASKFVLNLGVTQEDVAGGDVAGAVASVVTNPLDRALLVRLAEVVEQSTKAFERYDYARALQLSESFFWSFTDNYVELIKDRAYGAAGDAERDSVLATLATALDTLLRLFAPFLPFATEEVWSWWRRGSVHRSSWPEAGTGLAADGTDPGILATVGEALGGIRKAKSEAKVKQRTEVLSAVISGSPLQVSRLRAGLSDLLAAGNARSIELREADGELSVSEVELASVEAPAT